MKTKSIVIVIALLVVAAGVVAFLQHKNPAQTVESGKIEVITTLFPLYDMAKNIGGDKAQATLLLPPGAEAHSFEPTVGDIVKINEADIFVYTGKFMEPWAEDVISGVSNKNLAVVDASNNVKMIQGVFHDEDEPVGSSDPHIWLNFDNAKAMVENIKQAFIAKDAPNADFYAQRAADYENQLSQIDAAYRSTLSDCQSNEIVYGGHYAFGYLANRYGLKYLAAQGVSPDAEPSAKDLAALVDQIKKDGIKYVFYEELTTPKISETIASETNAKMLLLNAAHNLSKDQFESGLSFFDILNSDLENLKVGLGCK